MSSTVPIHVSRALLPIMSQTNALNYTLRVNDRGPESSATLVLGDRLSGLAVRDRWDAVDPPRWLLVADVNLLLAALGDAAVPSSRSTWLCDDAIRTCIDVIESRSIYSKLAMLRYSLAWSVTIYQLGLRCSVGLGGCRWLCVYSMNRKRIKPRLKVLHTLKRSHASSRNENC